MNMKFSMKTYTVTNINSFNERLDFAGILFHFQLYKPNTIYNTPTCLKSDLFYHTSRLKAVF